MPPIGPTVSAVLALAAAAICAASGVPGLFLRRRSAAGQRIANVLSWLGTLTGMAGVLSFCFAPSSSPLNLPWVLMGDAVQVQVDGLTAFFLVPVLLMNALGSLYGMAYWPQRRHASNGRKLRLFWGLVQSGMILLLISRHMVFFLYGWEIMALSAFFLVGTEDAIPDVRRASWLYLVATHLGTIALFVLFALWRTLAHTFIMGPIDVHQTPVGAVAAIYLLTLLGFGLKAGLMPLHFWLPSAHASAPSHVSAMMSGVLIKMGIYGLVRFFGYLPETPVSWGGIVLILGCVSSVLGVLFALGQHDLKRLLAYHSVENIGIIVIGLGLAMIGQSRGEPAWVALGMAGCLLHVWNHGLFKSLLFLCAGAVVHETRTRQIDQLGGLARRMPWTATLFFLGAVAICGIPPLNGFVSEWFVYLGLLQSTAHPASATWSATALAVPVLAATGGLALACFVKVYGCVFLGSPRSACVARATEAPLAMRAPMAVLAAICIGIGLFPMAVAPALARASDVWLHHRQASISSVVDLAPLWTLSAIAAALWLTGYLAYRLLAKRMQTSGIESADTWGCGYVRPTARIQYTASSFAQMLVSFFRRILHAHGNDPTSRHLFPPPARFESHVEDLVLDRAILPAAKRAEPWFRSSRQLHRGLTHHYLIYILVAVLALLAWTLPIKQIASSIFPK